ncbi:MAG TPA: DsbA family protein [Polyangiaceae bacterium]|jgi:protein-disulfide isomerase|nr:DsbA family protein [Polyangiaceae bacterium]
MPSHHLAAIAPEDHVRGAAEPALTIVQYGDYDCPHTRASTPIIRSIMSALPASSRFVFRHFPLRHLHANAQALSEIAEAAASLGHFWPTHDRLMEHRAGITQDDVLVDLFAAHVDVDAVRRLMGSSAIAQRIERDVTAGASSGVHSTPTWFFNGVIWDGHYDRETLEERIRLALTASP